MNLPSLTNRMKKGANHWMTFRRRFGTEDPDPNSQSVVGDADGEDEGDQTLHHQHHRHRVKPSSCQIRTLKLLRPEHSLKSVNRLRKS